MIRIVMAERQIDEAAWRAIAQRDRTQREAFIFAVKTTGIYCRPGCPARTPLRGNIIRLDCPRMAREAGFRACLRCTPDQTDPANTRAHKSPDALVEKACRLLANPDDSLRIKEVARQCGISRGYLGALFQKTLGISPKNFQSISRAQSFEAALRSGMRVVDAVYAAGYGTASRAYEDSAPYRGAHPRDIQKGGVQMTLRYAIEPCWLGLALIAASDRGICLVAIDTTGEALLADMKKRFPKAQFEEAMPASPYATWIKTTLRALEPPRIPKTGIGETIHNPYRPSFTNLPLDIQGTAFQQKVWMALRRIPRGQTQSYGDLAAAIGQPGASRAVASACGANKLAVIIPCHRVIGKSGQLSGYRWGISRKRALLEQEGALSPAGDLSPDTQINTPANTPGNAPAALSRS